MFLKKREETIRFLMKRKRYNQKKIAKYLEFSESYVKIVSIGFYIYETEPQIFFYHSFYNSTVMCFNRFFNN